MLDNFGVGLVKGVVESKHGLLEAVLEGKVFVYPTDTVYGLGCNALKGSAVSRIYDLKARQRDKPLSVIAPSKKWILEHFVVSEGALDKYLPGPYTLVLKKKDHSFLKQVSLKDSVGVRIPDHPLVPFVQNAGVPFVTTSANLSGEPSPASLGEIADSVLDGADIVLDGGRVKGNASTIVDFVSGTVSER